MTEEKSIVEKNAQQDASIKGNEAEEFIKKIVLKILFTTVVMVVGVGIAVYYTSGAV